MGCSCITLRQPCNNQRPIDVILHGFTCYKSFIPRFSSSTGINITCNYYIEEFEDTKGVIRIRISKKNRQHSLGQKKRYKRTNNDLQNIRYT